MVLFNRLSLKWPRRVALIIGVLLLSIMIGGLPYACRAAVIVLDPGHGGSDSGAGRNGQFPEKRFTLALAGKLASRLSGRHRVELTRTTDITVAPYDRAAIANQTKADVLISLHAGAPPYCSDGRAFIYVHDDRHQAMPSASIKDADGDGKDVGPVPWSRIQHRHIPDSRKLADALAHAMRRQEPFKKVTVAGAPMIVLMGADCPAVLVEVGCILTQAGPSPETIETRLEDYAAALADAIQTALPEPLR